MLARLHGALKARQVQEKLLGANMLIRDCSNFRGLTPNHIRFSLKSAQNNQKLATLLLDMVDTGHK
jgi:threonine-phosphate decarboxylase